MNAHEATNATAASARRGASSAAPRRALGRGRAGAAHPDRNDQRATEDGGHHAGRRGETAKPRRGPTASRRRSAGPLLDSPRRADRRPARSGKE
jgi:hypothetical protein